MSLLKIKKILCIHSGISYLPEIEAYKKYFKKYNIEFTDSYKDLNNNYNIDDFDLLLHIMGTDFMNNDKPKIHDYTSLSTGKYTFIKNKIKRYFNQKPVLRLFLNENVKNKMKFNDGILYLIRDMGVDNNFFNIIDAKKKFDFVYLGSVTKDRKIPELLYKFKNELQSSTLLVVGSVPYDIFDSFKSVGNITFSGKVKYEDVPKLVSTADYGINLIPNIYPFNIQTSTKLLEYCALGLKIITTNYKWANEFENKYSGSFFKIDEDLNNFKIEDIKSYNFKTPNIDELEWISMFDKIDLHKNIINKIEG